MARVEVPMPQMGESITEGTISVWLKKVGDSVERDEPIMEISTDKVDAEIPSPSAGVLVEVIVPEGATVEVGTVVAYVETDASLAAAAISSSQAPSPDEAAEADRVAEPEFEGPLAEFETASGATGEQGGAESVGESHPGVESAEERLRRRSTPLVRRIAEENGVRIEEVQGTGRSGRVTKEDVLHFVATRQDRSVARSAGSGPADFHTHVEHPHVDPRPGDRVEPMSRMTALIAEHMVLSKRISAHVHSYFEVDYSRVDQVRHANQKAWKEQGLKVTYTAFIARAVAQALREHPRVNAAISGSNVIYRGDVNLGIAVALEWGLIVPVVRKADELSLTGLSRTITDLAERARSKKLSPAEVEGGTFTITNPGIFGTVLGFPIVNQPQVGILAVGAVEKRPVVITDEYGNDAIAARKRGFLALGYDHRLVNGADADRFLGRVKEILETFPESG
jgi:pyruvate dehydrogenase E2 component (dihydrolipoamide acetyltransferase)